MQARFRSRHRQRSRTHNDLRTLKRLFHLAGTRRHRRPARFQLLGSFPQPLRRRQTAQRMRQGIQLLGPQPIRHRSRRRQDQGRARDVLHLPAQAAAQKRHRLVGPRLLIQTAPDEAFPTSRAPTQTRTRRNGPAQSTARQLPGQRFPEQAPPCELHRRPGRASGRFQLRVQQRQQPLLVVRRRPPLVGGAAVEHHDARHADFQHAAHQGDQGTIQRLERVLEEARGARLFQHRRRRQPLQLRPGRRHHAHHRTLAEKGAAHPANSVQLVTPVAVTGVHRNNPRQVGGPIQRHVFFQRVVVAVRNSHQVGVGGVHKGLHQPAQRFPIQQRAGRFRIQTERSPVHGLPRQHGGHAFGGLHLSRLRGTS